MYYVGIDIAKFKHAIFIQDDNGEVINKGEYFDNSSQGFNKILTILKSLDQSQTIKIGLEATSHYHMNLISFLQRNNYTVCELNPYLVKQYKDSITLRNNKNDFFDSYIISSYLVSNNCKPYPKEFYHVYALKSLTRSRDSLVKERTKKQIQLTNILDIIFPEFKPFFSKPFCKTSMYILKKYKTPNHIANMTIESYNNMKKEIKGTISYARFMELKILAKNTIGFYDDIYLSLLSSTLALYDELNNQIDIIDQQIKQEVLAINPKMLTIKGFGFVTAAIIIAEFNNFIGFNSWSKCLAYAGIEPGRYQSGQIDHNLPMVKHGSGYLRHALMYGTFSLLSHIPTLYDYYLKKRDEGKSHYVALSHCAKKILRVIFYLEKNHKDFDVTLFR